MVNFGISSVGCWWWWGFSPWIGVVKVKKFAGVDQSLHGGTVDGSVSIMAIPWFITMFNFVLDLSIPSVRVFPMLSAA
jgi:hypothetical protein